jgi:glycosyltransferase involved in cell wall biosynthesis
LPFPVEIWVCDSLSDDDTLARAAKFPAGLVTLAHAEDRSCGAGAQMGFPHATGTFVYVMDADMQLHDGFLQEAVDVLQSRRDLGGVGGLIRERNLESIEYRSRVKRAPAHLQAGLVPRLDGGGLYPRDVLERLGYLTDPNLHSFEELDLGIRLRRGGWPLVRLERTAVDHFGHRDPALAYLVRRWRTRYSDGAGELLRAALQRGELWTAWSELPLIKLSVAGLAWMALILAMAAFGVPWIALAVLVLPVVVQAVRKRSVSEGVYSVANLIVNAAALIRGFVRYPSRPTYHVDTHLLRSAPVIAGCVQASQ